MANQNVITKEGYQNLQTELHSLKTVKRAEIAQKIKEAREQGDLSENAEYAAAREEQKVVESMIEQIENILNNVSIVDDRTLASSSVSFRSTVKLLDLNTEEEYTYTIVGSSEADVLNGKISNSSPLGDAIIGHKKDEIVVFKGNNGLTEKYQILDIL